MTKPVHSQRIFVRLVITFLIIIIPIYALGLYIYNWGIKTTRAEVRQSNLVQSYFYLEELEKEIDRMKHLQFDCLNDESLNKLAFQSEVMGIYEVVTSINLLRQRLITIENSSSYIRNVSAHIATVDRTISSRNGVDRLQTDKYQNVRAPAGITGARIVHYQDGFYLSTVQYNTISSASPPFIIEIELNKDSFAQALGQFDAYEGSASALYSLSDRDILFAQTREGLPLDLAENAPLVAFNGHEYYPIVATSQVLNMGLVRFLPATVLQSPLRNFYLWLWIYSITVMLLILVYSLSTYRFIHKPLLRLVQSFRKVEQGDLSVRIQMKRGDEFGYLYEQFNEMVANLDTLIDQVYQQKLLMQRAELKQLQSQINPHFLYNSFFIINTMARLGDENLVTFSKLLGEYYQYITRNASDHVSLAEEVRHAFIYTELQKIRFSRRLAVIFEPCPDAFAQLKVPRLILQPIIENAFNHGVEQMVEGGTIVIQFAPAKDMLHILVENSGHSITEEEIMRLNEVVRSETHGAEITGLVNIHRRLVLVYGPESGLTFERSRYGGLKVSLKIKLEKEE